MDRGVVYVATGHKYLQEALLSAESVKRHMRHLSITLYTDEDVDSRHVDEVVHFDADGYLSRIPRLAASPYERTLFLDSDTYVCGDLEPLFALLDGFDIALAHAPVRAIYEIDGVPDSFPEFNAGVILFRQSADVRAVFSDWEALFDNFRGQVSRDEVRWLCAPEQRNVQSGEPSLHFAPPRSVVDGQRGHETPPRSRSSYVGGTGRSWPGLHSCARRDG